MKILDTIGFVEGFDPEVGKAMGLELARQKRNLELIASENIVSPAVMAAMGSALTNKYAEGYPSKRYYGGCECVDIVENIAIERACKLFDCKFANVQPHSGAQANMAVYFALCNVGDTIMGMSLDAGGHLTHGSPVNMSGKNYHFIPYGLTDDGFIDYDNLEKLARENKPKLIVAGASAYPRVIDFERISNVAKEVGAYFMVDMAHIAGLVATGMHPSPLPYADVVTTTTHKTLRGPRGGIILSNCGDEAIYKKLNSAIFPGSQGGPLMHVIAAKAIAFKEAMEPEYKEYQAQIIKNAKAMVKVFIDRGYKIVSGGTHDHLFLVDLIGREFSGKDADEALGRANITVNKNSVPNDPRSPFITSGLRIGTPAVTRRGLKEDDVTLLASLMCDVLDNIGNAEVEASVKAKIVDLCHRFPVYQK